MGLELLRCVTDDLANTSLSCNLDNSTNPSLGETLLQDIQQFLNKSSGLQSDSHSQHSNANVNENILKYLIF